MGNYQDALDYIFSYVNYEKYARFDYNETNLNLTRMRELLERLGNPQTQFRCVHIAGTKGKGSTSAMIESVLRAAGFRTGLYTSPHLHTFRERIRVDGKLMDKADLVNMLAEIRPAIEATPQVTTFEIMDRFGVLLFCAPGCRMGGVGNRTGGAIGCDQCRPARRMRHHLAELGSYGCAGPYTGAHRPGKGRHHQSRCAGDQCAPRTGGASGHPPCQRRRRRPPGRSGSGLDRRKPGRRSVGSNVERPAHGRWPAMARSAHCPARSAPAHQRRDRRGSADQVAGIRALRSATRRCGRGWRKRAGRAASRS